MSIATQIAIAVAGFAAFLLFFRVLQYFSDKTYRPTPQEMAEILRDVLAGKLTWQDIDEFSCVRIAYDKRLDQIRERCNVVFEDDRAVEPSNQKSPTIQLSEWGREQIVGIINELDALAT